MARYTGAACKLCRREGQKLFLKGERCYTGKCALERRKYAPGQHGQGRKKVSEYGKQLRTKQFAKRYYGVLEGQFRHYFERAEKMNGVTGENLLSILESRLDNVAYRLGFGTSRAQARQMILHGHVTVNGKKVDIPSYLVKVGDEIAVRSKAKEMAMVIEAAASTEREVPDYMEVDAKAFTGKFIRVPKLADIPYAAQMEPNLVIEYYSR